MTELQTLAEILQTTEKNALVRAAKLGIGRVCNRCGGTGRYSFNGSHSICYGCNGARFVSPKAADMPRMIEEAEAAVANGKFAIYMRFLEAQKATKGALDRAMEAWTTTQISEAYDWRNASGGTPRASDGWVNPKFNQRDADISEINRKMFEAYERVQKAGYAINAQSETYHSDMIEYAAILEQALKDIAAADIEFKEYLANH